MISNRIGKETIHGTWHYFNNYGFTVDLARREKGEEINITRIGGVWIKSGPRIFFRPLNGKNKIMEV